MPRISFVHKSTLIEVSSQEADFLLACGIIKPEKKSFIAEYRADEDLRFGLEKVNDLLLMRVFQLLLREESDYEPSIKMRLSELKSDSNNRVGWQVLRAFLEGKKKGTIRRLIPKWEAPNGEDAG